MDFCKLGFLFSACGTCWARAFAFFSPLSTPPFPSLPLSLLSFFSTHFPPPSHSRPAFSGSSWQRRRWEWRWLLIGSGGILGLCRSTGGSDGGGGRIHQPLPLPRESHRLFTPYTCGSVGGNDGRGGSNGLFPSCARIWRWRRREGWIRQPLPLLCGSHHLSTPIPTTTTTMGLKRCRCGSGRGSGSTTTTRMSGGVELHQRGIRCWELAKRGSSGEDQVRVSALFYFVKVIEIRSVTWLLVKIMFSQAVSLWGPTEKTDFCVRSGHPYVKNQDLPRHLVGGSWPGQMRKPLFTVWKDFFLLVLQGTHTIF